MDLYVSIPSAHTSSEVRKHERGRKKAPFLGSGRPKAAGDSVRSAGESDPELTGCPLNRSRHCGTVRITLVPVTIPGSSENYRRSAKAPLADQGELSRASHGSTRLRGSELHHFDNPSVSRLRETREPAPFTQGSRGVLPHQYVLR